MSNEISFDSLPSVVASLVHEISQIKKLLTNKAQPEDLPVNIDTACLILGLTKPTIYRYTSEGTIPHMKKGKRLYFYKKDLVKYLESGRVKTKAEIIDSADEYLENKKA